MNSLPPEHRGAGSGMNATFQNSAQVLSIGVFFTLIILGLANKLPRAMYSGLVAQHVPTKLAHSVAGLPPVGDLFAAFLGYNPMKTLLGPALSHLSAASYLTGRSFFPSLIASPFESGLREAFAFALGACVLAAIASWLRGKRYVHGAVASVTLADAPAAPTPVPVAANGAAPAALTVASEPAIGARVSVQAANVSTVSASGDHPGNGAGEHAANGAGDHAGNGSAGRDIARGAGGGR
jgi:hypothetical protein